MATAGEGDHHLVDDAVLADDGAVHRGAQAPGRFPCIGRRTDGRGCIGSVHRRSIVLPLPELPEIEVVRQSLRPVLEGASMRVVRVGPHDMRARGRGRNARVRGPWMTARQLLDGARIDRLERCGKQLAIVARDGRTLVVQLGMSGQLIAGDCDATHRHVTWDAVRGRSRVPVTFRDPRRFGGLSSWPTFDAVRQAWDDELGPDALDIDPGHLRTALTGRRSVKAALLDQRAVAGVGNIYADESLHRAGIDPRMRCTRLRDHDIEVLAREIRHVLGRAVVRGGSTLRDHRSAIGSRGDAQQEHAVYGRGGLPCLGCGSAIRTCRLAGRTTSWCPACQPLVHRQSPGNVRTSVRHRSRH
ncbi:MAG: bifunctional DNA-formamidopyrimidine glycosylase/DNA-(apurinic or apyrimidinic site) lyase [Phycisphaerales bacterium]|nr:bifunctional DNA-formamidopyrimidine glycosylase/DNA-(apurinic or apyrimidinic site) lyase [Phycisphaerales bacterium]